MAEVTNAQVMNCVTKWLIIIISIILAVLKILTLVSLFTADGEMDGPRIVQIVFAVIFLVLCVLLCYGTFTENACLCYIAFVFVVIWLIVSIWALVDCLFLTEIDNKTVKTIIIVLVCIEIALFAWLAIIIWLFIQTIKH